MTKIVRYLAVFVLAPQWLLACQQCFGANVNTATTRGIGFAMLALFIFTGFVSTGIVMFFLNISKRTKILSQGSTNYHTPITEGSSSETMNHLLDKINQSGFQSLTRRERFVLQEISKSKD
jgi:hypothetical protein